ncbi:MAG TPA: hypothetical protein VF263_14830 [Longimicrobiaceae bacterium]
MLRTLNLEEIQGMLLRVPGLVDAMDRNDAGFSALVRGWLAEVEEVLKNNRLAAAGEVAALRGTLIAAERGALPAGITVAGRATPRRLRDAAAADALRRAESAVSGAVRADAERVAEAEGMLRQVATLAAWKGTLPGPGYPGTHTARVQAAWSAVSTDPDTAGAALRVAGLVGAQDALILLDRALATVSVPQLPPNRAAE